MKTWCLMGVILPDIKSIERRIYSCYFFICLKIDIIICKISLSFMFIRESSKFNLETDYLMILMNTNILNIECSDGFFIMYYSIFYFFWVSLKNIDILILYILLLYSIDKLFLCIIKTINFWLTYKLLTNYIEQLSLLCFKFSS